MLERRVHPRLPRKRLLCFYPMAKRREGDDNWYPLPYDQRRELMGGHGKLGRQVRRPRDQLITGATGLSDWEWGVTLLSRRPEGHQGHRLRDALRRGLGALRRCSARSRSASSCRCARRSRSPAQRRRRRRAVF